MSNVYQRKESSIILSEKKQYGGEVDKRKSLNLAISNYFKQKEKGDESEKFKENFLLNIQSPSCGDHVKRSFGDDEQIISNGNNPENTVIGKLYEIMRRVKIK